MLDKLNELKLPELTSQIELFEVAIRHELIILARRILEGELTATPAQKAEALQYIVNFMNDGYLSLKCREPTLKSALS